MNLSRVVGVISPDRPFVELIQIGQCTAETIENSKLNNLTGDRPIKKDPGGDTIAARIHMGGWGALFLPGS